MGNGTYIAFAADGNYDFYQSDIRYYNLMKAWDALKSKEFEFINPHEKGSTIRSWSNAVTIKATLRKRMKNSTRFLLLVGNTTRFDDDFVPYEIEYAVDTCKLPVIVCYVKESNRITSDIPSNLKNLIPLALKERMNNNEVKTIHIPFKELIISKAINDFDIDNHPKYSWGMYTDQVYDDLNLD